MKLLYAFTVALLLATLASAEVLKGTTENFDGLISSNKLILVKFYAPWCGHCKKLAPEFKKASEMVEEAVLIDVDCTVEKSVCSRFPIQGYPTLIVFRDGKEAESYSGGRDAKSITAYMNAQSGPAVKSVKSADELEKLKANGSAVGIIMSKSDSSELASVVAKVAESMRASMSFVLATDQAVSPDDAMESVAVYRAGGEREVYAGPALEEDIKAFLEAAIIPYFGEINPETFNMYVSQAEKPIGWVYLSKDSREDLKKTLAEVARKHRGHIIMCWVDADLYGGLGQQMALPTDVKYPAFVIALNRVHHVQPQDPEINEESISQFIEKYVKGEVAPTMRSEDVPAVDTVNGLTTLVGNSISKFNGKKDVFILFYAPWCGHCKSLLPEYEKMAKEFESSNVIIAKFDATVNDMDRNQFAVDGYPTLYFIPVGKEPIPYSGGRTYDDMVAFVKQHATNLDGASDGVSGGASDGVSDDAGDL